MTYVSIICLVILGAAGLLCLVRLTLGPTSLNRTIAMDVFIAVSVGALGTQAALTRDSTILPVLVALSLLGFVGSVSIARFAGRENKEDSR